MDTFYALAEPNRRSIIEILAKSGQMSASSIAKRFNISPAAVSQHLKILREAKLVRMEKHAQQRIYEINPATLAEIEQWANEMSGLWNKRFDELEKVLEREKAKAKGKGHGRK